MIQVTLTKQEQKKLYNEVQRILQKPKLSGAKRLLLEIFETTDVLASLYYYPGKMPDEIRRIRDAKEFKEIYKKGRRQILMMKRQKLIEAEKQAELIELTLTEEGLTVVLQEVLRNIDKKLSVGKRLYVIFDFPENLRVIRDRFRRFLKSAGFRMEQRSVWSTDKDILDVLVFYLKRTEIKPGWLQILVSSNLLEET